MYDEIHQFREACGDAHMKTILAIGELGTFTNIYKASLVAMMAGQSLHDSVTYFVMFQFVFDFLKPLSHMNCNSVFIQSLPKGAVCPNTNVCTLSP